MGMTDIGVLVHRCTHNVAGINVVRASGTVLRREFNSGVVI